MIDSGPVHLRKIALVIRFLQSHNQHVRFPNMEVQGMLHGVPLAFSGPAIDAAEARWVASELTAILNRLEIDSPAGLILRQARRELQSLIHSAEMASPRLLPAAA